MRRPILIVVDMLNDFLDTWESARRVQLVQSINELVALMRESGHPIIWVRQEFEPDLHDAFVEMKTKGIGITIRGTRGCQIDSGLAVASTDVMLIKKRYSAFYGTNLDQVLTQLNPDSVILAGINTHACVRMTAIDAYQRDWAVTLAADCVDSYDREHHEMSMKYIREHIGSIMSNHEIRRGLERNPDWRQSRP